jgi:hypothetical protein
MFRRERLRAGVFACFALLGACGVSTNPSASENATAPTVTPTVPVAPAQLPAAPPVSTSGYDTSIGLGVDANGFADLSLRAGAHRYFINSAKGSDSNSCSAAQSAATPKASGAAALACTTDGEGDQLLFAEGTSYATTIPSMAFRKGGYSLAYPFVFQSYDPADPTNEAKYGRATGSNRPVFTGNTAGTPWIFGGTGQKFIAVRGFDVNPGNISGQNIGMVDVGDGILFENNLLRSTGIGMGIYNSPTAHHWIIRGNAIYGTWDATTATAGQGIYVDGSDSVTIEDNVLYHNGWKIGANRTDTLANGGASMFRHAIYQQLPADAVVRRNLIADGSGDCGSFRGNITHTENMIIDCPIAASLGGGTDYNQRRPNGVSIQSSYNAIIGSATVPDSGAAGWGLASQNGKLGSSANHNLIILSGMGSSGAHAFLTSVLYNAPSYMDYSGNLVFQWSTAGMTHYDGSADAYPGQTYTTYNNNVWDDLASGTNKNNAGTYPNPYTPSQLYVALGFTDKQAFVNYAISRPETFPARSARALLFAGYGIVP